MQRYAEDQKETGLEVALLDIAGARRMEPELSESPAGAAYSPLDGQVNPIALTHGLALAARALGARVRTHTEVTGIRVEHDGRSAWKRTRAASLPVWLSMRRVCMHPGSGRWRESPFQSGPGGGSCSSPRPRGA